MTETPPPPPPTGAAPLIRLAGVTKRFGTLVAADHVDLTVEEGEIHALLGENGAGKSTVMNVLAGLLRPDDGQIILAGKAVTIGSPSDAFAHGIGMIHQHFKLDPRLSVAANVVLGLPRPRFWMDWQAIEREVGTLAASYGLAIDPRAAVGGLSIGEQQRVEILKALYRRARILIMDEPTAVLAPLEVESLFTILRRMASTGHTILFISHKLAEVMSIAARVTVLRRGRTIATLPTAGASARQLSSLMVGREVVLERRAGSFMPGATVLETRGFSCRGDTGATAVEDVTLRVRAGEIVGLAGVAGNGQRELAEAIAGLRRATAGQVLLQGHDMTNRPPRQLTAGGLGFVPEDRQHVGLVEGLSIKDNLILRDYENASFSDGIFLKERAIAAHARELIGRYAIAAAGPEARAGRLSGGNMQKVLLARELSRGSAALVVAQPTRGLDIAATEFVWETLRTSRAQGRAILLISEDLDEILALADTIAVLYRGQLMGTLPGDGADTTAVGMMMMGSKPA